MNHDVIVLGLGSMGSATCYELARRGARVLGIDQFNVPHENGSHGGQSRIIRKAYFEHPDYVPLLLESYDAWREFESVSGEDFYTETGLLYAGAPDSILISGVEESARIHDIRVEVLSADEQRRRFPMFNIPSGYKIIHEPESGFIRPEAAVGAYLRCAKHFGATVIAGERVLDWQQEGEGVVVRTTTETYRAEKLILAAGAWTGGLLKPFLPKLKVTRQVVTWFQTREPMVFRPGIFPCWLIDEHEPGDVYYGFPQLEESKYGRPGGLKVAQHNPGRPVNPDEVERGISQDEVDHMTAVMERYFPGQYAGLSEAKTCLYTYSPDEHFILDFAPGYGQRVVVAAGFSGHGFKFVPVVGKILADLAMHGQTSYPVGFLSASRAALIL